MNNIGAIILAAGKGKRMGVGNINKVSLPLANKPIILHIVHFIKKLPINKIIIVIGHAKASVEESLKNEQVIFAEQSEQLGTGNALRAAFVKVSSDISCILVVYGDEAILYQEKQLPLIKELIKIHQASSAMITFLTIDVDNPIGLGRIVRKENGQLLGIIEEKDATETEKNITEINPGCFLFDVNFLQKYIDKLKKSTATGEFYITNLIDLALQYNEEVQAVRGGKIAWRGVNTKAELLEAEKLYTIKG